MKTPCYNCTSTNGYKPDVKRTIKCHDTCKYYKQWKYEHEQANKNRQEYMQNRYDCFVQNLKNENRIILY